jgi:uncharacterized protein with von Willebrand factor type A (vWA) domain
MPFADKFRAMMDFPFPGDRLGGFAVETVDVSHHSGRAGVYNYDVQMVLRGPGGQQGVRRALKAMLSSHPTTFSGYGNPYQLWFGKPQIESLGDRRYEVKVEGGGARTYLQDDLERFLDHLVAEGTANIDPEPAAQSKHVETYLKQYRAEIKRHVGRYRYRLRKLEDSERA